LVLTLRKPFHRSWLARMEGVLMGVALFGLVLALIAGTGLHQIREGHVGLYWRGGALLQGMSGPGLHWRTPLIESYAEVQTTIQTDSVSDIPCGTSGGVVITFSKVEVVNRLDRALARETVANYTIHYDKPWIFDKVHHEINQFCSRHSLTEVAISMFDRIDEYLAEALKQDCMLYAPGIEIIAVRVTKPQVPISVKNEFEKREAASAALKVAEQQRQVIEAQAETEAKRMTIEAQRDADVALINSQREVTQQKSEQQKHAIKDAMHLDHEKALADAHYYMTMKNAEANKLLLTAEYLELMRYQNIASNTKIYFGDRIPTALGPLPQAPPS